jgi:hypothetical protein
MENLLLGNRNSSCIISIANYGVTELQTPDWFSQSNQTRYRHWLNPHDDEIVWHETGSVFVAQPDCLAAQFDKPQPVVVCGVTFISIIILAQ